MSNGSYRLVMAQGPTPGKVFELVKDILTIGRDVSNDIVVNDAEVSRHHSRLTRQVGGYMIEDLSSTNGTFVNGQRLIGPRPLSRGDQIGLGETVVFGYEQLAPAESSQATMVSPGVGGFQPPPAPVQDYSPAPAYAPPPPPQPAYAPPPPAYQPPPAPAPQMPLPPPPAPRAQGSRTNMYIGIGCGCLLLIAACVAVGFALDAYAPDLLYSWLPF
jgi:hypothetical protein